MNEVRRSDGRRRGLSRLKDNYFVKTFFLGLLLALVIFVPFMVIDRGRFLFYGDFNVQQVPFYRLAHDAVRSGEWGWNYRTDLGVNFIGSYSFYLLGSPFFWLTIPFPSEWVQFLMGPLLILKFACAALTGYVYIHRYTKTGETAMIGAVLYAFSGFSVYNIFFNHFHEAIIMFPLLLAALDEYMATRRRGLFALTVFGCCLVNYYFFVGQVTFTIIYFFLRLFTGSWHIRWKDFLLLALEAVVGLGLSCGLLVPSVLAILQNNRLDSVINGWPALMYTKNQRYLHIIECFFFPPDLPARPNFTPESDAKWASLGAWLPLFSMTGVIGWLQLRKKHWLKKMIWILFLMAMVPFLNSSFQMMNSAYYARWYYTLTLMMALATVMALENERTNWKRSVTWTLTITLALAALVGLMPKKETVDGNTRWTIGLEQYPTRFWTYVAIAVVSLSALVYVFAFRRKDRKMFYRSLTRILSLVVLFYSIFFIALGKTQADYTYDHLIPYSLNGGKDVDLPDLQESRSDFYESLDNAAMFWKIPSIQAFHSIVPGSVMDFYESIGVTRDVASRPDTDHYALRGLTSVHWLFDDDHDDDHFAGEDLDEPRLPGFVYYGNANGFDIWENLYYVPMGFSYDCYVPRSTFNELSESEREKVMMKAVVIEDSTVEALTGAAVGSKKDRAAVTPLLTELPLDTVHYTEEAYLADCRSRIATACTTFRYTRKGFMAERSSDREDLVFFSVPWEGGWSAKVNGEPAEIYRVNVGFMAVAAPSGEKVMIEFTYRTPGLSLGILISAVSLVVFILYLALLRKWRDKDAAPANPGLFRRGTFADYQKKRSVSFRRPGALTPHFAVRPAAPDPVPEQPAPEQQEQPEQQEPGPDEPIEPPEDEPLPDADPTRPDPLERED